MRTITLSQLLNITNGVLIKGNKELKMDSSDLEQFEFSQLHSLDHDDKLGRSIALFKDKHYLTKINDGLAGIVITNYELSKYITNNDILVVIVKDPYSAFAKVAQKLDNSPVPCIDIHPTAIVPEGTKLGRALHIGAYVVIGKNVSIGDNTIIESHCSIGDNCIIGDNVRLHPHVVLYHGVELSDNVVIHSLSVIGADGFGYANESGKWIKIPQIGTARIGRNTEIGSLTSIDRGALKDTIVEDNCILDNHIHLGHNVQIGTGTAMAGGTIVAGSTTIGKYCIIGGASVFNGHIKINDFVTVTGMAMVSHSLKESHKIYSSGIPVDDNKKWLRSTVMLKYDYLKDQSDRLKKVEERIESLQSVQNPKD